MHTIVVLPGDDPEAYFIEAWRDDAPTAGPRRIWRQTPMSRLLEYIQFEMRAEQMPNTITLRIGGADRTYSLEENDLTTSFGLWLDSVYARDLTPELPEDGGAAASSAGPATSARAPKKRPAARCLTPKKKPARRRLGLSCSGVGTS